MQTITLENLLDRIALADDNEVNAILNTVTERFEEVHPDWELLFLTVHGHESKDRMEALQKSIELLSHCAKNDLP